MGEDLGKHGQVFFEGETLFLRGEGGGAVRERNHAEALLVAGASGRFHTAVGQEAGNGQGINAAGAQDEVQICAGKGIEAAFSFYDNIFRSRGNNIRDGRAPGAAHEGIRIDHTLRCHTGLP